MKQGVSVPQAVIDEHTLIAQTYAGFLVGHPIHASSYLNPIHVEVDRTRPWTEPNPVQDSCIFCVRLTDDEAERRVFGFQAAIDREVLNLKWAYFNDWVLLADEAELPTVIYRDATVIQPDGTVSEVRHRNVFAMASDFKNRRRFIENEQHTPRPTRPNGWQTKAAAMVSLPLRLKRKMCIEWNHCYLRWMIADDIQYDFDKHEFYRDIQDLNTWNEFIIGQ